MRNTRLVLTSVAVRLAGWTGGVPDDARQAPYLIYLHGRIVQEQQYASSGNTGAPRAAHDVARRNTGRQTAA